MKDDRNYSFKMNLLCVLKNIIVLACFTILAIVFNKWWIVLFSALFLSSVEKVK